MERPSADRLAKAKNEFEHALALDPQFAPAIFNLGILSTLAGSTSDARNYWERYLRLDNLSGWAEEARERLAEGAKR
jgi:Flp pilus assembly protein TadD